MAAGSSDDLFNHDPAERFGAADDSASGDADRNNELFLELLTQHEAQLLGFLCAIAPSFQDAEDLFQQTVLTMWQKFAEFEPGTSFTAWGCRIARFKAMSLSQSKRLSLLEEDVLELLTLAQEGQTADVRIARRRALSGCIEKLGERDRNLIQAAYTNHQTIKSLAADIGRSASGVYNSLARIRSALFKCIQATLTKEGLV